MDAAVFWIRGDDEPLLVLDIHNNLLLEVIKSLEADDAIVVILIVKMIFMRYLYHQIGSIHGVASWVADDWWMTP